MDIQEIIKLYNEDGLTLVEIGEKINSSKSTISRFLANNGYVFCKSKKKYIHKDDEIEEMQKARICEIIGGSPDKLEVVNTESNKTINNVSRETINTGNNKTIKTVKCTFDLPEQLHRELKAKCALEGRKMVDLVKEVLEKTLKSK